VKKDIRWTHRLLLPAALLGCLSLPERAAAQHYSDWSAPVNLGPAINSGANNQHPAISRNGLSLYYSSDRSGTFGKLDIWVSQRPSQDADWGTPQNLGPHINSTGNDLAPAFTPNGHWMYFHSDRPGGCGPAGTSDLYISHRRDKRDDFGWEPAENLGCMINSIYNDAGPTFFEDEELDVTLLYFTSTRPAPSGGGDFDIYVSTLQPDGTWGPGVFVPELSSPFRDTRSTIRKDGLEMIISSGRPGGVGNEDIWVSTRATTADLWSTPVNLGAVVNSTFFDGAPALSRDAKTLYFFSERPSPFENKRDLYVTTRTKLKDGDEDHGGDDH
jgi:WD40-like Beta Propeller Repeat